MLAEAGNAEYTDYSNIDKAPEGVYLQKQKEKKKNTSQQADSEAQRARSMLPHQRRKSHAFSKSHVFTCIH